MVSETRRSECLNHQIRAKKKIYQSVTKHFYLVFRNFGLGGGGGTASSNLSIYSPRNIIQCRVDLLDGSTLGVQLPVRHSGKIIWDFKNDMRDHFLPPLHKHNRSMMTKYKPSSLLMQFLMSFLPTFKMRRFSRTYVQTSLPQIRQHMAWLQCCRATIDKIYK